MVDIARRTKGRRVGSVVDENLYMEAIMKKFTIGGSYSEPTIFAEIIKGASISTFTIEKMNPDKSANNITDFAIIEGMPIYPEGDRNSLRKCLNEFLSDPENVDIVCYYLNNISNEYNKDLYNKMMKLNENALKFFIQHKGK